jgi:hypothetical protein
MRDVPDGLDDCFAMQGYCLVLGYEEQSAALNSRVPIHRLDRAPIDEVSCIHAEILKRPHRVLGGDGPWLAVPVSQHFCCGADSQISGHAKGERRDKKNSQMLGDMLRTSITTAYHDEDITMDSSDGRPS